MALNIETFSNAKGGNAFFKAIGHPLAARKATALLADLKAAPLAIYDPLGFARAFAEIYDLSGLDIQAVYVQDLEEIGSEILGQKAQPVTDLAAAAATKVLVTAFDAERLIAHVRHLLPAGTEVVSLDEMRLPEAMLTNRRNYLDSLNFATNLVFFRDGDGHHTRLATANYWSAYGARAPQAWCCLMDAQGTVLAEWQDALPGANASVVIDSKELRERFGLYTFTGSLFLHICGIAGHDIVKYALDTYGDDDAVLSCTHDANSWPADLYGGLPAPKEGEQVLLWVQNSHPAAVPAGSVGLNLMGDDAIAWLDEEIPPFGTRAIDTAALLPAARWPQQIEVQAGKHFVRPRYEVIANGATNPPRRRIAHANVERVDLKPDPRIPELANLLGKGFILPAPILPRERFRSIALPTPMSTCQANLPLALFAYDPQGKEIGVKRLGKLPRNHATSVDIADILDGQDLDWGHMELVYDFAEGGEADGWLHGLFRYEDKTSGHIAETSFGAHVFNTVMTYKGEPQSYAGRPPGLSTRLFLSFGPQPYRPLCHLIYPASTPWHAKSQTNLMLHDANGDLIAEQEVQIACGGSLLWQPADYFSATEIETAGPKGYVIIRDTTCRLFGYHGLMNGEKAFSFDHMFGF
ncbi:hypothetical protein HBA54_09040 [Pelagibius litoralis]|uniref:Uncharacterized protein n=1 Tax=Pelagibius litoralis TaxID=374515 RepID=A0A967EVY7_9PROT|nr:hypothetical protein [Pelagibius litoralis]NIA68734.1 hypothetical protein [Pelagibius litoralis]